MTQSNRKPLKRFRDADIPPAPEGETKIVEYGKEQSLFIKQAKKIVSSWLRVPKEWKPQSNHDFIEQKKEMFLVELSYKTIQDWIKKLDEDVQKKEIAIEESDNTLQRDNELVKKFQDDVNIELENCLKEAAEAEAERKALEEKLKDITDSISNLTSEYIKSKDTLE